MDLNQAIAKHAEWKVKFRTAIDKKQQLSVGEIARDNCCDLGRWLHGDGRARHGSLASFQDCQSNHAAFHVQAGRVAQAINDGRYAEAETMLGAVSQYGKASQDVALAIRQLKKDAGL